MNKLLKGSIAGAAGIALLLGGAGTFALWNDSAAASGGTVQSGALSVALKGSAAWKDISADAVGGTTWAPATDKLVPGDTVTYTQQVDVTATGKNLKANLSFDPTTVVIDPLLTPAGATPYVTVGLVATKVGTTGNATIAQAAAANTYTVSANAGGTTTFELVFTIKFDKTLPTLKAGQSITNAVAMNAPGITVVQLRP